jgi:hypothetical protein
MMQIYNKFYNIYSFYRIYLNFVLLPILIGVYVIRISDN